MEVDEKHGWASVHGLLTPWGEKTILLMLNIFYLFLNLELGSSIPFPLFFGGGLFSVLLLYYFTSRSFSLFRAPLPKKKKSLYLY